MATPIAKLNKEGQLVSTTTTEPPITVNSSVVVTKLNADMVDGLNGYELLRSNAGSTLTQPSTLSVAGEIKINPTGKLSLDKGSELTLGWFKVNMSDSLISISYNPS